MPEDTLALTPAQARAAVGAYLRGAGAYARYPGLSYAVRIDGDRVEVSLHAPLEPAPDHPRLAGARHRRSQGSAVVGVDG